MYITVFIGSCNLLSSRGKGDYFRLGHGTDAHVRKPQLVEALKAKKVVHVSVGALHCLAVTDSGQVSLILLLLVCLSLFHTNIEQQWTHHPAPVSRPPRWATIN